MPARRDRTARARRARRRAPRCRRSRSPRLCSVRCDAGARRTRRPPVRLPHGTTIHQTRERNRRHGRPCAVRPFAYSSRPSRSPVPLIERSSRVSAGVAAPRRRSLPPWPARRPLRAWQQQALEALADHDGEAFLASATPAAGKTTFGLRVAYELLQAGRVQRVAILAPTAHIARQWAADAARYGIDLEPNRPNAEGPEPSDRHGVAVTYQAVAAGPRPHRSACAQRRTLLIADEPHHMGEDAAWGTTTMDAFARAELRLLLSGTPFRSDNSPIPWVEYDADGFSSADYTYTYTDALIDGVCRPITFVPYDGDMEWIERRQAPPRRLLRRAAARRGRAPPAHRARRRRRLGPARAARRRRAAGRDPRRRPPRRGRARRRDRQAARDRAGGAAGGDLRRAAADRHLRRGRRLAADRALRGRHAALDRLGADGRPRASTSRACASASTRRARARSCSSARSSAASSAARRRRADR